MRGNRLVQVGLFLDAQTNDDIDIEVALAEIEVGLSYGRLVRGDEYLDYVVLDLVAQLVGLGLVE